MKINLDQQTNSNDEDKQNNTIFANIWSIVRSNWLPFVLALAICLLTIIVVPIIYSIDKSNHENENAIVRWNISAITIVNQSILLNNQINNSFGQISSIKLDVDGNLLILDKTNNRLTKFEFSSSRLSLIFGHLNGSNGTDVNSLNNPNDFLVESSDVIYLVDTENSRLISYQRRSQQSSMICFQTSTTRLKNPMSMTMDDRTKLIYIADYGNNLIQICNLTTNQLTIFKTSSSNGNRNTYVLTPISIRFDSNSRSLLIGQQRGFNVVRWSLDSTYWTLVAGSASSQLNGTSRTLFNQICSIEISGFNSTFVVDCENQRIQYYIGDLTKGRTIAGVIQAQGNNSYIFNYPTSITFDQSMNLYVADSNNQRIQLFTAI